MRILLIILIVALGFSPTSAQSPIYRLREPDVSEYLASMPDLMAQMEAETQSPYAEDNRALYKVLSEALWTRYPTLADFDDASFDLLVRVNSYIERHTFGDLSDPQSEQGWYWLMLTHWLRENQPDLSTQDTWYLNDESVLKVQPVDFNGDGTDELAADFQYQEAGYREYFVLQRDLTRLEGYSRFGDTEFWEDAQLYDIRDATGDGLPEWMVSRGYCGWGRCGVGLNIFSWQHQSFVSLTPESEQRIWMDIISGGGGVQTFPPEDQGSWTFKNLDEDVALELIQREYITDTRGCDFTRETIFQFDETSGTYQPGEPVNDYPDTDWCVLRQAHDAMQNLDFEAASQLYEHFLTFTPPDDLVDIWHYARMRLAIAYGFTGRTAAAAILLKGITAAKIADPGIRLLVETAKNSFIAEAEAISLCQAVYRAFDSEHLAIFPNDSLLIPYGQHNDHRVPQTYGGGDFGRETTGCNLPGVWRKMLQDLNPEQPLQPRLEALGWEVVTLIEQDGNNDGMIETLVQVSVSPEFSAEHELLSAFTWWDGENWQKAPFDGRGFSPINIMFTPLILPDSTRGILITYYDDRLKCSPEHGNTPGYLRILRLYPDGTLRVEPRLPGNCRRQSLAETFPSRDELHLYDNSEAGLTVYRWNSETKTYEAPPSTTFLSRLIAPEQIFSCTTGMYEFCGGLYDPGETLRLIDLVLANPPPDKSSHFFSAFHYYRALVLEALNRPDEALTEYIYVYETAPETPWGKLAKLHLEIE